MCANHSKEVGDPVSIVEDKSIAGSGHCKACGCRGYRPNSPKNDYCKDCGHSWYMHEGV
jgi:hypothetical protein